MTFPNPQDHEAMKSQMCFSILEKMNQSDHNLKDKAFQRQLGQPQVSGHKSSETTNQ